MKPSASTQRILDFAADHGVALSVEAFPEGTKTAQDAADAVGCEVAAIVKSLVFMADDAPLLGQRDDPILQNFVLSGYAWLIAQGAAGQSDQLTGATF